MWKTDPKTLPLIQFPIEFGYLYFGSLVSILWLFWGLEEIVYKSAAPECAELDVDGKGRQVSIVLILSRIFYH